MLKTIRYVGPIDAVDVPLPSGLVATVERYATVDLPDGLADRLLEQTDWVGDDEPYAVPATLAETESDAGGDEPDDESGAARSGDDETYDDESAIADEEVTTDAGR
jgi:hypothetical protein